MERKEKKVEKGRRGLNEENEGEDEKNTVGIGEKQVVGRREEVRVRKSREKNVKVVRNREGKDRGGGTVWIKESRQCTGKT